MIVLTLFLFITPSDKGVGLIFTRKKKKPKFSILNRPYRSYINSIYVVMNYGKKVEILPEFRITPSATHGIVAGMSKLGYISICVIDGKDTSEHYFESYMLD